MVAVMGLALLVTVHTAIDPAPDAPPAIAQAAAEAGVKTSDLMAAMATTGIVDPYQYLIGVGELEPALPFVPAQPPPRPIRDAIDARLDCIQHFESRGVASATNPSSKAAGLFQFLWSTWAGTPQGRAGLSPYDPVAARSAARWMLSQGRAREWVPVQQGLC